jgi:hypothetical protein
MKPTQQELTDWAIAQIRSKYKDDVALLIAVPGISMDDDCHGECFDYFVPANERGNRLARTFIIDGVGHDLYPRSWKRIEAMAQFWDDFTYGLGEGEILYARSEEDSQRFAAMQAKQRTNMQDREYMFKTALGKLDTAMDMYRTMVFEDALYKVRMASGYIAAYLSVAVACINGTYSKKWLELGTSELAQMKDVPDGFTACYRLVVKAKSADELRSLSHTMISTTRRFLEAHKPPRAEGVKTPVYEDLASWYQELSLTWRRIYRHCGTRNADRAFADSVALQRELNVVGEQFALREMDLLGTFDAEDFSALKLRAQELEQYIVSVIAANGVTLNSYDTLEEFLAKNR